MTPPSPTQTSAAARPKSGDPQPLIRSARLLRAFLPILTIGPAAMTGAQPLRPAGEDRLIHAFDFDERDDGNLEPIPKYWSPFIDIGFPAFAHGQFDESVGHDAAPSFRLSCQGRNVLYRYLGPETRIDPRNDHLVVAWIRTKGLKHARAAISALYVTIDGVPIPSTERFAPLLGDPPDRDHHPARTDSAESRTWRRVELRLPDAPPEAATIGVSAWIVQDSIWKQAPKTERPIQINDVAGTAWFDDIHLYRLPRITVRTRREGNLFLDSDDARLDVSVTDIHAEDLSARVLITDALDRPAKTLILDHSGDNTPLAATIDLSDLQNGFYTAHVYIESDGFRLAHRRIRFAVLNFDQPAPETVAPGFGIAFDRETPINPQADLAMLRGLRAGAVKIPVWTGQTDVPDLVDAPEATRSFLYELARNSVRLTAVLAGPPNAVVRSAGPYNRSLVTLVQEKGDLWRTHLAAVVSRYANVFRQWQFGPDESALDIDDASVAKALHIVRAQMETLVTAPRIAATTSLFRIPGTLTAAADETTLLIDDEIPTDRIDAYLADAAKQAPRARSAFVPLIQNPNVKPISRWSHWVRRILLARSAGIDTIYVPQLWRRDTTADTADTEPPSEPLPEYVLLATLSRLIGDAKPAGRATIAGDLQALSFHGRNDRSTLVLWDPRAGESTRDIVLQLGDADRRYDIWGRPTPLPTTPDGQRTVRVGAQPTIIPNVPTWLVAFQTSLTVRPNKIELNIEGREVALTLYNPHKTSITGTLRLDPPPGWDVQPRLVRFSLAPGQRSQRPVQLNMQRDASAGPARMIASVDLLADRTYHMRIPLPFEVGTQDLDAWGLAFVAGNQLIVRHGIINRSPTTLNIRSYVAAPGRMRQYRTISAFQSGDSTTLEYRLPNAQSLRGRSLRLHLRELNGPRFHNLEIPVN